MKNYKLLVFDWDGTLIDSVGLIVAAIQATARELNLPEPSVGKIRQTVGAHLDDIIYTLFPTVQGGILRERFLHHYAMDKVGANFFTGVADTLVCLKGQGYSLAVATNKPQDKLEQDIIQGGLTDIFTAIRCPEMGYAKPHPWMMLDLLEYLDLAPDDALMIGDTTYDMQLAQNAGVDALAVTYGSHDRDKLLAYSPIGYIDDIVELQKFFDV